MTPEELPPLVGKGHAVTAAGGAGTGRRYGATFTLRLPTGGLADEFVVEDTAARLAGAFTVFGYDALAASAPLAATVDQTGDGAVIVQLDGPRRLSSVRLQPSAPATSAVLVHRVDGRVPTADPTLVVGGAASSSGQLHAMSEPFRADRFALRRRTAGGDVALTRSQLKEVVVTGDPDNPTLALRLAGSGASPAPLFTGALTDTTKFDTRTPAEELRRLLRDLPRPLPDPVELELLAGADGPCSVRFDVVALPYRLSASGFADLPLRVSDVTDREGLLGRLRGPAEPVSAHLRAALSARARAAVDAKTDAALGLALADLSAFLSAGTLWNATLFADVALPAEAAALVARDLAGGRRDRLNRLLLEAAWPGVLRPRREPRRLEVTANAAGPEVAVTVPAGATQPAGLLTVRPLVEPARPHGADGSAEGTPTPTAGGRGVALDGRAAVAVALDVAGAVRAEGIDVALLVRDASAVLGAEVRAGHLEGPTGVAVRDGPVVVTRRGVPVWARVRFDEPLILQPGRSWVVLRADAGRAVWLAPAGGPAAATPARVAADGAGWEALDAGGPAPMVRLVTVPAEAAPAVTLSAGAVSLTGVAADDGALAFTLDPLLVPDAVLALRLPATASGRLLIDPPTLTYDLAPSRSQPPHGR